MESEREETRGQDEGSGQQQPIGQQDQSQQEFGQSNQSGSGSEPPRSLGDRGEEFGQPPERGENGQQGQSGTGQADLGSQSATTLAGRSDQQDMGQDQPGRTGGAGGAGGQQSQGGFVASQDEDSGEYLQQGGSPESGFAEQGRGASNDGSDIERMSERSQNRESDIEGSSDNS
jgi:hypothetical protein